MKLKIQTYYHTKFIAILFLISCSFWHKIASSNTMKKNIKNYNPDNKQLMKNSTHRKLNNPNNYRGAVFFNHDFKNKFNDYNKKTIKLNKFDRKKFEKFYKRLIKAGYKSKYNLIKKIETKDIFKAKNELCSNVLKDFDIIKNKIGNLEIPEVNNVGDIGGKSFKKKRATCLQKKYKIFSNFLCKIKKNYNNLISELDKINNNNKDENIINVYHLINLVIDNMLDLPEFVIIDSTLYYIKIPLNNIIRCTLLNTLIVYPILFIINHENIVDNYYTHKKTISSQIYEPLLNISYILGKNIKEFFINN